MINFILVPVILILASYIYLKIAVKFKIIDKPNQRSSHTKITVRGGGIIFTIAIFLFFIFNDYQYPYFVLGIMLISIISFLDDIYTLSSKIRFPFQLLAVFLIVFQLEIPISPIYLSISFLIYGVGIANMFNFMDGVNGITGLYSLSVLLGMYMININENIVDNNLIIYAAISLLIFGFYNFRKKALFFAGDIGSIVVGMLIFFIGLFYTVALNSTIMLSLIIVYGADAGCTLLYRKIFTKESVFDPHRHHIYQKLVDVYGISHMKVSLIYALIQLAVNFIILKIYKNSFSNQIIIFSILVLLFIFCYLILFKTIENKRKIIDAK